MTVDELIGEACEAAIRGGFSPESVTTEKLRALHDSLNTLRGVMGCAESYVAACFAAHELGRRGLTRTIKQRNQN